MFTLTRILALLVVEIAVCIGTLFRPFYGVLFLLLLIFIRPQDDRPNMQELHYPAFVMGAIIVSTLLRQPQIQKRLTAVLSCLAPFIVILVLMWISGRVNGYTPESAFQITEFLTNLIFCSLLVFWIDSEKRFTWTIVALLLAGVYYVRQILGDPRIFREEIGGQRFERVALRNLVNFGNPNYLALLMILVFFLALSILAMKLTIWKKLAVSGAILAYLYVFLKCQSRGASVAFCVSFVVFWLAQKRKVLLGVISILIIGIALVFLAPTSYFTRMGTVANYEEDASAVSRLEFWRISLDLIKSHPLLGIGPANFMRYAANSQHESYLEIASETGLLGLCLYVGCLIRGLALTLSARSLASEKRKNLPVLFSFSGGLASCIVALIVQGFFTGFSYREFVYTILTLSFLVKELAVRAEAPVQSRAAVSYAARLPVPAAPPFHL